MIEFQGKSREQTRQDMIYTLDVAIRLVDPLTEQIETLEQIKRIINGLNLYYDDLNDLCKRLQDNINDDTEFQADEQDRNALCYILDLVDGFTNEC